MNEIKNMSKKVITNLIIGGLLSVPVTSTLAIEESKQPSKAVIEAVNRCLPQHMKLVSEADIKTLFRYRQSEVKWYQILSYYQSKAKWCRLVGNTGFSLVARSHPPMRLMNEPLAKCIGDDVNKELQADPAFQQLTDMLKSTAARDGQCHGPEYRCYDNLFVGWLNLERAVRGKLDMECAIYNYNSPEQCKEGDSFSELLLLFKHECEYDTVKHAPEVKDCRDIGVSESLCE
jgi:hypothetical protein